MGTSEKREEKTMRCEEIKWMGVKRSDFWEKEHRVKRGNGDNREGGFLGKTDKKRVAGGKTANRKRRETWRDRWIDV